MSASVLASFSLQTLLETLFCVCVILICYFAHKKYHKIIPLYLLGIYAVFSQAVYLYYHLISINQIVPSLMYLVFGELFLYASINIFKTLLVKGVGLKLTIDECVCIFVFFGALGAGLSVASPLGFPILNIVAVFFILLATFIYSSTSVPIVLALSFGLGYALQTGGLSMLAIFGVISICSVMFKSTNKYFSVMAIIIADVVLGLYFNAYGAYNYKILTTTILGEVLFLCISNQTLLFMKTLLGEKSSTIALRGMVNRSRDNLCKKMYNLSEVFDEMDRSFKSTIRGLLPAAEAKQMLKEELLSKVCYDCPEKHRCHRILSKETNEILDAIISAGLDRGKVTLLDIPPFLSGRCSKTNIILNNINQLINSYKQYTYCVSSVDTSKALIAEEFQGVSKLLKKLADQTKELVTFDEELESKLVEELNYVNIMTNEAYIYQKDGKILSCTLTLKNKDISNPNLYSTLSKNFGTKMALASSEPSGIPGFTIANFAESPRYECIFGSSGANKFGNTVSGDSYSFLRLPGNKILLSVCDGMGSGEDAQKLSDTTISLIENFYKVDFDDETILSSVNKLLSMQMTESYSALDICMLNLSNALADFIKVGAPAGFVKHKESVEVLSGSGALPIGILQDIKPSIDKKALEQNDIIILCSDGVVD
ncbi:MAG: SpoIIE family protein phosphatase, partial [Clostridia bacterium]|nr:SpoIIE family protein phosphatase [Clostridia bacterium]